MPFNVIVNASSSAKLTKNRMRRCLRDVFIRKVHHYFSWSGKIDATIFNDEEVKNILCVKTIETQIISPKTTRFVHPLDMYFVRQ